MANQATTVSVYDAGLVRLTEQALAALALEADYQPTGRLERSALDLHFGLETIGLLPKSADALTVQQYAQNTYGLLGVGLDPLLAPLLPVLPSQGAEVRARALLLNGKPVLLNGRAIIVGYRLAAPTAPVYNTTLLPTQYAGPVTYNGVAGTELSFNAPMPTGGALFLQLYVGSVQAGRVDFPSAAVGQGFSLLYNGILYYGTFQSTSDNKLLLS